MNEQNRNDPEDDSAICVFSFNAKDASGELKPLGERLTFGWNGTNCQYHLWMTDLLHLNFGNSFQDQRPVLDKIVESGLKTYYKEVCLLEQAYIHDPSKSVDQAVKEAAGRVGGAVEVKGFFRYALGEGIEKQESDFAAEVAAASGVKA